MMGYPRHIAIEPEGDGYDDGRDWVLEEDDAILELEARLDAATRLVALLDAERDARASMTVAVYVAFGAVFGAGGFALGWLLRGIGL